MINKVVSRIISGSLLASIAGWVMHISDVHNVQMGRAAFLAKEAARFDRLVTHPVGVVGWVIGSLIVYGSCLIVYELVALAIRKILERINADNTIGYDN
jgi:hypothetical protein